ncbi:hypothetical protein [Devosia sp.]|uniref:hypothetical protein n=1 Tax=Devosia sp. TaxID=1871048 RepID=UPI0025FAEDF5|nr:hypothetical protein [Devosia sp.]MCR6634012.1 hypothetical protein [Devosia sp.]
MARLAASALIFFFVVAARQEALLFANGREQNVGASAFGLVRKDGHEAAIGQGAFVDQETGAVLLVQLQQAVAALFAQQFHIAAGQQAPQCFGIGDGIAIKLQALAIIAIADDHATVGGPAGDAHGDRRGEGAVGMALHRVGHGLVATTAHRQGGYKAGKCQGRCAAAGKDANCARLLRLHAEQAMRPGRHGVREEIAEIGFCLDKARAGNARKIARCARKGRFGDGRGLIGNAGGDGNPDEREFALDLAQRCDDVVDDEKGLRRQRRWRRRPASSASGHGV